MTIQRFVSAADNPTEYEAIWNKPPSAGLLRRDQQVISSLDSGITRIRPAGGLTAADVFKSQFRTSKADVVTLVGHNDHGVFKFSDGSAVTLGTLGSGGPKIALVSCGSAFYASGRAVGLPSEVTLAVAADIESAFIAVVNQLDSTPDVAQMQKLLDSATAGVLASRMENLRYTFVVSGGGVLAVTTTVIVWEQYPFDAP